MGTRRASPKFLAAGFIFRLFWVLSPKHILLRRRTKVPVCAEVAVEAGSGIELSRCNATCHRLNLGLRLCELRVIANRLDRNVLFEVVKHQTRDGVAPLLFGGQRID